HVEFPPSHEIGHGTPPPVLTRAMSGHRVTRIRRETRGDNRHYFAGRERMTRRRTLRWILLLVTSSMAMTVGLLQAGAQSSTPAATPEQPTVVREVLASGEPDAAPGELLELVQYTIPGNITLPVHVHPGMQVSTIVSGELIYTVLEGEAYVTRA